MPDATTPPTGDYEPSSDPPPRLAREKAGDRIGPYKLVQKVGEGGMGAVRYGASWPRREQSLQQPAFCGRLRGNRV